MSRFVDAHCHVSSGDELRGELEVEGPTLRCVMSNNGFDWGRLKSVADEGRLRRGFGIHPWYCHLYSFGETDKRSHYESVLVWKDDEAFESLLERLPEPVPLEEYISREFDPSKVDVVGEIGLDRLFRLPENGYYVHSKNPAPLSRVKVKISHQMAVFERFLRLACASRKPISIHDVKCHGVLFETCVREILPCQEVKVCLHSYTGSPQTLRECWLRRFPEDRLFLSVSKYINFRTESTAEQLLKLIPPGCILTETDFPVDIEREDDLQNQLEYTCRQLAKILQLGALDQVKALVYDNYHRFIA
ncbi:hypothetical protein HG537_0G00820 [Torulaspora globosa]|uniref:Metallo-dependent hydrolase n=1 Tax=Torulaspora globosa TaxID=48254 RepID=A0A7H9HVS2_9SACH|nr:hypothetical protein HG537_0G00820 [Torulaspora sp. CBS 2947]